MVAACCVLSVARVGCHLWKLEPIDHNIYCNSYYRQFPFSMVFSFNNFPIEKPEQCEIYDFYHPTPRWQLPKYQVFHWRGSAVFFSQYVSICVTVAASLRWHFYLTIHGHTSIPLSFFNHSLNDVRCNIITAARYFSSNKAGFRE